MNSLRNCHRNLQVVCAETSVGRFDLEWVVSELPPRTSRPRPKEARSRVGGGPGWGRPHRQGSGGSSGSDSPPMITGPLSLGEVSLMDVSFMVCPGVQVGLVRSDRRTTGDTESGASVKRPRRHLGHKPLNGSPEQRDQLPGTGQQAPVLRPHIRDPVGVAPLGDRRALSDLDPCACGNRL